ncbi:MAG: hypothetical protein GC202_04540 [Alphaproteobacteria bacterium]|nr:hypothetical protein [Alphaproteobacteria bacterium]
MKDAHAVLLAARFRSEDALTVGRTPEITASAAMAAHEILDRAIANIATEIEEVGPVACRKGCNWCCHQHVAVLGAEALAIYLHIKGTPAEARVRASAPEIVGRDARARRLAKIPCPFVDGETGCAIYAIRPNRCRSVYSRDSEYCFRRYEGAENEPVAADKPIPVEPVERGDAAMAGLRIALDGRGIPAEPVELVHALIIFVENPDAAEAYAAGEDVLRSARLPAVLDNLPAQTKLTG